MSIPKKTQHCCGCGGDTEWEIHRGHERCTRCRRRFPCESACDHLDCGEARGTVRVCPACSCYVTPEDGGKCPRGCAPAPIDGERFPTLNTRNGAVSGDRLGEDFDPDADSRETKDLLMGVL